MKDPELKALEESYYMLSALSPEARKRILIWLANKFNISLTELTTEPLEKQPENKTTSPLIDFSQYREFHSVFSIANPRTEAEKVLLAAAYLQEKNKTEELTGRSINNVLKRLGHGVKNITATINLLIDRKPRLMMLTKKEGSQPQSQKRYKVTIEGLIFVAELFATNKTNHQ
ncbi:MAG: hypothetical protein NZ521_03790 [Flammeovirgaceae bacterium]|nr:hypothetical protein [Flammeovirgaceae bacterium]MDW8287216.1 hypothetical protein [Flammeovirgaceae bacterium]